MATCRWGTHRLDEFREDLRDLRQEMRDLRHEVGDVRKDLAEMSKEHGGRLARIEGRLDPAPRLPLADPE